MGRYKVYTNGIDKVVVASTYAGKVVRGVAKCNPADTFDFNKGIAIAQARCDYKIAKKRYKRATEKFYEAEINLSAAQKQYNKMTTYMDDAFANLENTFENLESVLNYD